MPEENQEQPKKRSYKVPIILVVVWGAIIALFSYSLLANKDTDAVPVTNLVETTIDATPVINAAPKMTDAQIQQSRIRDTIRLNDMRSLRSALQEYNNDNGNYPEELDNLIPDYMETLPQNPVPGGQTYVYTGIGSKPYSYYDMTYELEVGAEGINPGLHVTSPGGIATP